MRQIAAPTAVASVSPSSASLNPNASEFVSTRTPTAEQAGVEATPATPQASTAPAATAATPAATTATPVGTSGAPATITQAVTPAALTPVVVTPATAPLAMVQSVDESMPSTSAMPVAQPGPSSMTASVAPTMKRYFFLFYNKFSQRIPAAHYVKVKNVGSEGFSWVSVKESTLKSSILFFCFFLFIKTLNF